MAVHVWPGRGECLRQALVWRGEKARESSEPESCPHQEGPPLLDILWEKNVTVHRILKVSRPLHTVD